VQFPISDTQPYRRTIDLDRFLRFDQIGTYVLQMHYDWTYHGSTGQSWNGEIISPPFTVTILSPAATTTPSPKNITPASTKPG
jgi:hypothetical protein